MSLIAEIAVPFSIHKTFSYLIKEDDLPFSKIGMRVLVPFGAKKIAGYVVELHSSYDNNKNLSLKEIELIFDEPPLFNEEELKLYRWISAYYAAPLGEVLKLLHPSNTLFKLEEKVSITQKGIDLLASEISDAKTQGILEVIKTNKKISLIKLKKYCGGKFSYIQIQKLKEEGIINISSNIKKVKTSDKEFEFDNLTVKKEIVPTKYQQKALEAVNSAISSGRFSTFLLNGVTGSGKTFVYIDAVKHTVSMGKSAIVLVPEISLTPQLVGRFTHHFEKNIAVIHSGLSESIRRNQWLKIKKGDVKVVIGARSAIFAPLANLGLIIVDEEHESFYKQDDGVRYNARDTAIYMGKLKNLTVLLGSATPSIDSFYNAAAGKYTLLNLPERVKEASMPDIEIVDLKNEEKGAIFSKVLLSEIKERVEKNEQVILFLNRKGFSTYLVCSQCGFSFTCPKCSVALTYHFSKNIFKCSYCALEIKGTEICPACKGKNIEKYGFGTEKIESEIVKYFPSAKVGRFDSETVSNFKKASKILKDFSEKKLDILCGTQLVAKGHDFPDVTLVGVLNADISMQFPDFRASERTYQIITQVSGRSGRGEKKGKVIIQTFNPDHFSILAAKNGDYISFYEKELSIRKRLKYPPFVRITVVRISAKDEKKLWAVANESAEILRSNVTAGVTVLGPSYCPISKINNFYRGMILIKGTHSSVLNKLVGKCIEKINLLGIKNKVKIAIDVDPQNML